MAYASTPLNSNNIYPFGRTRYVESVVRNLLPASIFCGFLGAHGKRLNAFGDVNGKDFHFKKGDLETELSGAPGHRRKRMYDHYLNALANKIIRTTINHRAVYYAVVANATAFNVNDICWWDDAAKLAKPAAAFTWTTDLPTTQTAFALKFLGFCLDKKVANDGQVVLRFDLSPLSAFDCPIVAGTAYKIGQTFGPAKAVGSNLVSTTVAPAVAAASCLSLVSDMTATDTNVLVAPQSVYYPAATTPL